MHTIIRNLVVVKPIQPLIDWVNNHLEWEQPVTLDQLSRNSTVYLIPEAPNDAKALKYILAHKNHLFAVELNTWNKDPKTWSKRRIAGMFYQSFYLEFSSMIYDLDEEHLYSEEL